MGSLPQGSHTTPLRKGFLGALWEVYGSYPPLNYAAVKEFPEIRSPNTDLKILQLRSLLQGFLRRAPFWGGNFPVACEAHHLPDPRGASPAAPRGQSCRGPACTRSLLLRTPSATKGCTLVNSSADILYVHIYI